MVCKKNGLTGVDGKAGMILTQ